VKIVLHYQCQCPNLSLYKFRYFNFSFSYSNIGSQYIKIKILFYYYQGAGIHGFLREIYLYSRKEFTENNHFEKSLSTLKPRFWSVKLISPIFDVMIIHFTPAPEPGFIYHLFHLSFHLFYLSFIYSFIYPLSVFVIVICNT